jgi:glycosyltransferase A (GT-A) superfamily protein (DUF2064 family)
VTKTVTKTVIETVIVIAKEPIPGRVKTRLVPPLSYVEAAAVAEAALADTLAVVSDFPCPTRVIALDGRPGPWLPAGWTVIPQVAGGLDVRLTAAFAAVTGPALLVGMDTPQLKLSQLLAADLDGHDACLGPADDGGYWAIGLRDPRMAASVIDGVPMSTADTGRIQLARLVSAGLRVQLLDQLSDVDTFDVATTVAERAPWTRFADTLTRVSRDGAA